jgi:hypothetical protein
MMTQARYGSAAHRPFPLFAEDFTPIFERLGSHVLSFTEADALQRRFWDRGEDARLREDHRFRKTPWDRWMRSDRWLANDRIFKIFDASGKTELSLQKTMAEIPAPLPLVFCTGDPRFQLNGDRLTLTPVGQAARSSHA